MFDVRIAGGHLYGKQLFTWLSLVVSLMASFVLSFFPLDVLDEIWDLVESVSEGFLTYSFMIYSIRFRSYGPDTKWDVRTDGWMDGQTDGWTDGQTYGTDKGNTKCPSAILRIGRGININALGLLVSEMTFEANCL